MKAQSNPQEETLQKLMQLVEFLGMYQHPEAEDYRPEVAELSVVEMPLAQMSERLRDNIETHWDNLPEWKVGGVKLDKAKKRAERHILEIKGVQIDNALKVLDLDDQPRLHRYKGKLYYVQYRPVFPNLTPHPMRHNLTYWSGL